MFFSKLKDRINHLEWQVAEYVDYAGASKINEAVHRVDRFEGKYDRRLKALEDRVKSIGMRQPPEAKHIEADISELRDKIEKLKKQVKMAMCKHPEESIQFKSMWRNCYWADCKECGFVLAKYDTAEKFYTAKAEHHKKIASKCNKKAKEGNNAGS